MKAVLAADAAERKLKAAKRVKPYDVDYVDWLHTLGSENVISEEDINNLMVAAEAVKRVVDVDDFPNDVRHGASVA